MNVSMRGGKKKRGGKIKLSRILFYFFKCGTISRSRTKLFAQDTVLLHSSSSRLKVHTYRKVWDLLELSLYFET